MNGHVYVAVAVAFATPVSEARDTIIAVARSLRDVSLLAYQARPFGAGETSPYYITRADGVPAQLAHELADQLRALETREQFAELQIPLAIGQGGTVAGRFAGETGACS